MCDSMFTVKPRVVSEANAEKNVQSFCHIYCKKKLRFYTVVILQFIKHVLVITLGRFPPTPFISQDFLPFEV